MYERIVVGARNHGAVERLSCDPVSAQVARHSEGDRLSVDEAGPSL